jgi:hypothetical protein
MLDEWGTMGFWDANRDGTVDSLDLSILFDAWGPVPVSTTLVPPCLLSDEDPLVRDYLFDTGLADKSGRGVDAISLGGSVQDGSYVFGAGAGLKVPVAGEDWSDFDISMRVRFTATSAGAARAKIVDLFDRTLDRGLYRASDGAIVQVLPPSSPKSEARVPIGFETIIRYARDASTHSVSLWIDGMLQWTQDDPKGLAVPPSDGFVTLFADDAETGSQENCAGFVEWVRVRSVTGGG